MNTFGNVYRITTFGESHGVAVGGVIDGIPAGITVDEEFLQKEMKPTMWRYYRVSSRARPQARL